MSFQTSLQLGHAEVPIEMVRPLLLDHLPVRDPHSQFFVVRHGDEAVRAIVVAETADGRDQLVAGLESAARSLAGANVFTPSAVVEDVVPAAAGCPSVRVARPGSVEGNRIGRV